MKISVVIATVPWRIENLKRTVEILLDADDTIDIHVIFAGGYATHSVEECEKYIDSVFELKLLLLPLSVFESKLFEDVGRNRSRVHVCKNPSGMEGNVYRYLLGADTDSDYVLMLDDDLDIAPAIIKWFYDNAERLDMASAICCAGYASYKRYIHYEGDMLSPSSWDKDAEIFYPTCSSILIRRSLLRDYVNSDEWETMKYINSSVGFQDDETPLAVYCYRREDMIVRPGGSSMVHDNTRFARDARCMWTQHHNKYDVSKLQWLKTYPEWPGQWLLSPQMIERMVKGV